MKTITKNCQTCNISFESDLREHNRGNGKYCSLQCSGKAQKRYQHNIRVCINCNESFDSGSNSAKYCSSNCKQKYYRKQQVNKEFSVHTFQRILGHLPCEICGWNECTKDVHHIIPVSQDGKSLLNNLIVLCPNHHRMIHRNLVSKEAVHAALKLRLSLHPELYLEQDAHAGN